MPTALTQATVAPTATPAGMPAATPPMRTLLRAQFLAMRAAVTHLQVRRVVAAIIAVAVNTDGRREIVGARHRPSEAEPFWSAFLKSLVKRGLDVT
jgi:transposase-like protein